MCLTPSCQQLIDGGNHRDLVLVEDDSVALAMEALSPVDCAKAVHKKWIGEIFDVDPDSITASHILDKKCAFACFGYRFFFNHETTLGFYTHGRLEQLGGDVGDESVLDRGLVFYLHLPLQSSEELTANACAADLLIGYHCFVLMTTD